MRDTKGRRVQEFFEIEARALYQRFRAIETLLPAAQRSGSAHAGEEGRYIEALLRDFLNRHLPAELRALSGFILRPATKVGEDDRSRLKSERDQHSTQLDIIIYDVARFPVYERFEEFVIVPPEGVVGVVSVKKTLRTAELRDELKKLADAAELCRVSRRRGPHLGLFSFTSEGLEPARLGDAIFAAIKAELVSLPFESMVNEVAVLDRLVVFKFAPGHGPDGKAKYVRVDCPAADERLALNVPLQRLIQSILSVYCDPSRTRAAARPGFVSFPQGRFSTAAVLGLVPVKQ